LLSRILSADLRLARIAKAKAAPEFDLVCVLLAYDRLAWRVAVRTVLFIGAENTRLEYIVLHFHRDVAIITLKSQPVTLLVTGAGRRRRIVASFHGKVFSRDCVLVFCAIDTRVEGNFLPCVCQLDIM